MSSLTIRCVDGGEAPTFQVVRSVSDVSDARSITAPTRWPGARPGSSLARDLQWYLESYLDYPFPPNTDTADRVQAAVRSWGESAFTSLFDGGVGRDYYREATRDGLDDLELQIIADDHPGILAWPWEALRADGATLGTTCTIRRRPHLAREPYALPEGMARDRVNILLVTARPYERDVQYTSISRPLVELINTKDFPAHVTLLRPPTLDALSAHLETHPGRYHVVHFDGHGSYGGVGGAGVNPNQFLAQGCLVFEDEHQQPHAIGAAELADVLRRHRIPAIVLNACQSAMADPEADQAEERFASVAAALSNAGVRSVVAMSYILYVSGAQRFLPAFYEGLFRSGSFAEATRAGREAMRTHPGRVCARGEHPLADWMVPVLHERDPMQLEFTQRQGATTDPEELLKRALEAQGSEGEAPEQAGLAARLRRGELFVGRDGPILHLERWLRRGTPAALVHGLGGVGKTMLARGFVTWLEQTDGPFQGALAISFQEARTAEYVLNEMGVPLFGERFRSLPAEQKGAVLARALCEHPVLVVWDNFENAAGLPSSHVEPQLTDDDRAALVAFLEALKGGARKVLITSRSREAWLPVDLRQRLELGGLRGEDRWELCTRMLKDLGIRVDRDDPGLARLMALLGGHPLSMRVILPKLETMTASAIADAVQENLADLELAGPAGDDEDEEATIRHLYGPLRFATDTLPEDLRPLLIPLALHERYADADYLLQVARQVDPAWSETQVSRFVESLTHGGLVRPLGQGLLDLHPALSGHLRAAVLPRVEAPERERWTRAFVEFFAVFAQNLANKPGFEQRPYHVIFGSTYRSALARARELSMLDAQSALLWGLGRYAQNTLDLASAERLFREKADVDGQRQDLHGQAVAYGQIGRVAQERRDFDAARQAYEQARSRFADLGDDANQAVALHQLGMVALLQRDYAAAEGWYRKSLEIEKRLGNEHGAAQTYHQLGYVAAEQRDFTAAEGWYRKSLEIEERLGNEHSAAKTYHQLGMVAQEQRDFTAAEGWYRKSLEIEERLGDEYGAASTYHQLGNVAEEQRDFTAAEGWYRKALEIEERLGNEHSAAKTYHQLGMVAEEQRDYAVAEGWYRKSLEIEERLGDEHGAAGTYHQLAMVRRLRGELLPSMELELKALGTFGRLEDPHSATVVIMGIARTILTAPDAEREPLRRLALDAGLTAETLDDAIGRVATDEQSDAE